MYVDHDGETILETKKELQAFAKNTPCVLCSENARDILTHMKDVHVVKLVFSTTCEHKKRR